MSFQDIAPPSASDDHQLYDLDQQPPHPNIHDSGHPGTGNPQDMRFIPSGGPQSGNFGGPFGPMDGPGGPCGPPGGGRSGPMSGSDNILQWQQGHYMGANNPESGFVSGAGTGPNSQVNDEIEEGGMGFHTGPGSITGSSLYDLDTAHPSEVSSLQSSILGVHNNPDELLPRLMNQLIDEDPVVVQETMVFVEKVAKKENFLNAMIRNIDFVGAIIQSLVIAMNNLNEGVNALAVANNANESGTNTPNDGNGNPQQRSLTERVERAEKQTRQASNILRNMTNCTNNGANKQQIENQMHACHTILHAHGIPPITSLLSCRIDRIKFNAIATIHSLLICFDTPNADPQAAEQTKQQIRESGGVENMVELLREDNSKAIEYSNSKLLTILADCLRILATKNQPTKEVILQRNGPNMLVDVMRNRHKDYKNLILMTTRLLKVISCCPKSKRVIIESGGMEALAGHLSSDNPKIIMNCLLTMRNMSDLASGIPDGEGLCLELVNKLRHPELANASELVNISCATGILANLTANNETLKLAVCNAQGVQALVNLLHRVPLENKDARDIFESALSALKHLTNNHRGAEKVQHMFVFELNGLGILNEKLNPNTNRAGLKGILNVINNLLLKNPENHEAIKREQIPGQLPIPRLIMMMLRWAMDQLLQDPRGNNPVDGVRMTELVDASLKCSTNFAKEPIYNDVIRDKENIRLFRNILVHFSNDNKGPAEALLRFAIMLIEIIASSDLDGAFIIYQENIEQDVIKLASHNNQKIAQSASGILHAFNNMRQQEQSGNFHPSRNLQQSQHTQMQNPNLQNIPPPGGNGFGQGPVPNPSGAPPHLSQAGPPGYNPRNQLPPLQQQSPMHSNPNFDHMIGDQGMPSSGQSPQMQMGQRHPMQSSMRGPPPVDGRVGSGGPPGYVDDMSMEMGHMNVTSPPYNQNFPPDFNDFNM